MGSGHAHGHAGARHRWRLVVTFCMVATFFVVELVVGLVTGSLALLSDAGHMAADVVALGAALLATSIAARADRTGRRTYGSYRAEVLASGFTVLVMLGVATYILLEAWSRRGEAVSVEAGPMLAVGTLGLLINVISLVLLRSGARESINVKGAYLEVMADALGSVGVVVAAVLVMTTGSSEWDAVLAVGIALFVAFRAAMLGREVLAVLSQHAPAALDIDAVARDLETVPGVRELHDLHVWTLTSGMDVATAHLVVEAGPNAPDVLATAQRVLQEGYGITHATLQVEIDPSTQCHRATW